MGGYTSQTEVKVSIIVALVLVFTAFIDLRIAAGLAVVYLIVSGVQRLRRQRKHAESGTVSP